MTAAGRPSVTEDARAEAQRRWPGALGGKDAVPRRAFIAGAEWAAARAETTTGAIARGEALAAGDPDWMNVTRWPRTEAEATTVILRLIAENRRLTDIENGWRHDRSEWEAERDALAAKVAEIAAERDQWREMYQAQVHLAHVSDMKVARVEALAAETEQAGDPLLRLDRLRAALTEQENDQ